MLTILTNNSLFPRRILFRGPVSYTHLDVYKRQVEPAPIHMVQPAYRSGTVLAYDRYLLRGFANADGARIDVERNGKTTTVLKRTGARCV